MLYLKLYVPASVTVGTKQAKAADALKWTGSFTMGTAWEGKAIEVKTDEGSTIEIKGNNCAQSFHKLFIKLAQQKYSVLIFIVFNI